MYKTMANIEREQTPSINHRETDDTTQGELGMSINGAPEYEDKTDGIALGVINEPPDDSSELAEHNHKDENIIGVINEPPDDSSELAEHNYKDENIIGVINEPPDDSTELTEKNHKDDHAPDGGWGWLVAVGTFFVLFFTGGVMKSSGVLYLKFMDKFDENALTTAWVFSLFSTLHLVPAPIASVLVEMYSCRSVVYFGTVLSFIGMLVSTFMSSIFPLYFSFSIVVGFGKCLIYTSALIIITKYFNKRRGLATGIATTGGAVGIIAFPPFIQWLFTLYDYRGAMLVLTALTLQTLVCGALFRSVEQHRRILRAKRKPLRRDFSEKADIAEFLLENQREKSQQPDDTNDTSPSMVRETDQGHKHLNDSTISRRFLKLKTFLIPQKRVKKKTKLFEISLLKNFVFLTLCIAIFAYAMSMIITLVFLPPLAKSKGISEQQASLIISIIGLSDMASRILSGVIFDLPSVKPYRLLVYNSVLYCLGLVSMAVPMVQSYRGFAAVAISYGILMGCYTSQKTVVTVDVIGVEKMPSSFGLLLMFQGLGSLIGPTVAGLLKDVLGSYNEGFYLAGVGLLLGASLFLCGNVYRIVQTARHKHRSTDC